MSAEKLAREKCATIKARVNHHVNVDSKERFEERFNNERNKSATKLMVVVAPERLR